LSPPERALWPASEGREAFFRSSFAAPRPFAPKGKGGGGDYFVWLDTAVMTRLAAMRDPCALLVGPRICNRHGIQTVRTSNPLTCMAHM
jgi:hypothetical protein